VSAQRRSVHPNVPGVPWWGAVMIAVTATAIGFAFDAGGGKELTHVFAALYVIGCLVAILMVRQSGIFTAIVQPPMILSVSVPGAYYLFHGAKVTGLKDAVINCAYPLIERFPLMLVTAGVVLLIGLVRWFVGSSRSPTAAEPTTTATTGPFAAVSAKIAGMFSLSHDDDEELAPPRRHAIDRPTSSRTAQQSRATNRAEPARPRRPRARLPENEFPPERPRRRTPPSWQPDEPVDLPRRRPPAARTARNPYEQREALERRAPQDRRGRNPADEPFEDYELPPRRRPGAGGAAMANGTHHPISRVRYRGSPTETQPRQERPVRRHPRESWEAETWEYDI
jgi:hypothetical protein